MDEMYPQMLKPINWKDFKALSVEQQLAYLNGIREIYHPSMIDFSTLFGCSEYLFRKHAKEIGFKAEGFYNHKKKTPEETREWHAFLDQAELREKTKFGTGDIKMDKNDPVLGNCPHCGGKAEFKTGKNYYNVYGNYIEVMCTKCRSKSARFYISLDYPAKEEAAKSWNRRVCN